MACAYAIYSESGVDGAMPYIAFVKSSLLIGSSVTVSELHALMRFDRRLEAVMMRAIEPIERRVKAQYRNAMVSRFGDYCLYDSACFRDRGSLHATQRSVERELRMLARGNRQLLRRIEAGERVPCGIALRAATFGTLSRLVGNTRSAEAVAEVATSFGLDVHCLVSWLKTLTAVRNACAHFDAYCVKRQIPSVPLSVAGAGGDHTRPLYALLVIGEMLAGRAESFGSPDRGELGAYERGVRRLVGTFAREHPGLSRSLGIPAKYLVPALPQPGPEARVHAGPVSYSVVSLAA